ncbi:SgcJ/EcaC family oxidoreductase [Nakamurella flava]|uniref:SgcJ/EcaC family oxidoreductase n=1 Tax=Nakamurella flava TaxID=2576308 RepID=A0A4U6QFT3_9ACTN|nr:SgcJ/EcaC family oxidoreductase [Nakamurella flava]TKV58849.1 SgcJ/EcaC family oxidoreductase [Nakamurella flava]
MTSTPGRHPEHERRAVERTRYLAHRLMTAYNDMDADAFAALFTPDAVFINIFGTRMPGRAEIARGHRAGFETRLAGTALTADDLRVALVHESTTVAHLSWTLRHTPAATAHTLAPCRGIFTLVAASTDGADWAFVAATNVRQTPTTG